jgi:hypothetical protein
MKGLGHGHCFVHWQTAYAASATGNSSLYDLGCLLDCSPFASDQVTDINYHDHAEVQ